MSAGRGKTRAPAMAAMTNAQIAEAIRSGTTKEQLADQLGTSIFGIRRRLEAGGYNHSGEVVTYLQIVRKDGDVLGDRDYTWEQDAICGNLDPAMWDIDSKADHEEGKRICRQFCPVAAACLKAALEEEAQVVYPAATIRGALDPLERYALLHGKQLRRTGRTAKCANGHIRTEENTYRRTGSHGDKRCRDCDREQTASRRNPDNAA